MVITSFVIQKCYLTFNTVLTSLHLWGRTAGSSTQIKAVAPNCSGSHGVLHWHAVVVFKKNASALKNVLKKH